MAEWFVSPTGLIGNTGAIGSPWDLVSAASGHSGSIVAGDTVWMRAGNYSFTDTQISFSVSGAIGAGEDDIGSKVVFRAYNPTVVGTARGQWLSGGKGTAVGTGDPTQQERVTIVETNTSAATSAGAITVNGVNGNGSTTVSVNKATNAQAVGVGHILTIASGPAAGVYRITAATTIATPGPTSVSITPGLRGATAGGEVVTLILNPSNVDMTGISGSYLWFWGIEAKQIVSLRSAPGYAGAGFSSFNNGVGVGVGQKFINCVTQNFCGSAYFIERTCERTEIYGAISYNSGGDGTGDGGGHDFYIHHDSTAKTLTLEASCLFNSYSLCMQMYDAGGNPVNHIDLRNCITFNSGQLTTLANIGGTDADAWVIGGGTTGLISIINAVGNYSYWPDFKGSRAFNVGATAGIGPGIVITDNYAYNGGFGYGMLKQLTGFSGSGVLTFQRNTLRSAAPVGGVGNGRLIELSLNGGANFVWGTNTYYRGLGNSGACGSESTTPIAFTDATGPCRTQTQFQADTGFSDNAIANDPGTTFSTVIPRDRYEAGQGLAVYINYANLANIPIDLSNILNIGDTYVVHDVRDIFGAAILGPSVYAGGAVNFPNTQIADPTVIGAHAGVGTEVATVNTAPKFNVFLVRRTIPAVSTSTRRQRLRGLRKVGV